MPEPTLFEFTPSGQAGRATLALNLSTRSSHPVSPLLYGKFCEHLGYNIYQGMEAQILYNPTFGRIRMPEAFPRNLADRFGWPDAAPVADAYGDGGAIGWFRIGAKEEVPLSPDAAPEGAPTATSSTVGPRFAQRVETPTAGPDAPKGIAQWTYLPLHRTGGYEFRVVARAAKPCRITLQLAPADPAGKPERTLAQASLDLATEWATFTGRLNVAVDAGINKAGLFVFSVTAEERANFVLGRVLLYPDDHIDHADPEIIRMLKEALLPLLRWPGGNFVSAYNWRDGVGPPDLRPTYPNPVWSGVFESNLFGTDDFLAYCRNVGCQPLICVNAGSGTPEAAAAWVEYCNGPADSPLGSLRAANGHAQPYGVKYWEIGNEIFGRHQTGWTTPAGNVDRFLRFSAAMRKIDPTIRVLACGGLHLGVDAEWNRRLITAGFGPRASEEASGFGLRASGTPAARLPGEAMTAACRESKTETPTGSPAAVLPEARGLKSEAAPVPEARSPKSEAFFAADCHTHHILEGGSVDETVNVEELYHAFMGYPIRIAQDYRLMRRRMLDGGIARPRLAITELQLFAFFQGKGQDGCPTPASLPTPATIAEALYFTLIVNECIRLGDLVEMITHSATVNHGGGLRKAKQRLWGNPVHYAHVLGAPLAGMTPVGVKLSCGSFSTAHEFGHIPIVKDAPNLDALAVLSEDGKSLSLMLVHRCATCGPIELSIDLGGFAAAGQANVLTLAGQALNDQNTYEKPEKVIPRPSTVAVKAGRIDLTLPPFSVVSVDVRQ